MKNVRVFFSKTGDARYLSHLDVMRCFTRALNRTGLDIWYTQGFNTHIYLMFACPLSLGFESLREAVDFRLEKDGETEKDIVGLINAGLPDGIRAYEWCEPEMKHTDIQYSEWNAVVETGSQEEAEETEGKFRDFFALDSIPVMKKTKKGEREEDALPYVKYAVTQTEGNCCVLRMLLSQNTDRALNPKLLLQAFSSFSGVDTELARITRTGLYDGDMRPFR